MLWINGKAAVPKLANLSHTSYWRRRKPGPRLLSLGLLKRSQYSHCPVVLALAPFLHHTTSLTILLQRIKHRWLEGARFWTHPIQRTQELHQDEGCIF